MAGNEMVGLVLAGAAPRVGVEPFFMELVSGMEEVLAPTGRTVLLLVVPDVERELATYRRWAREGTVQAVVVVNLAQEDTRPAVLAELGLPAVLAGRHASPHGLSSVITDDAGAMHAAMDLLASQGHRVVGRVSGPAELVHTAERTSAMRSAAERLGLQVELIESDYTADGGVRGARALLAGPRPPSVIVFDNDVMALAAEVDLVRAGTRVPEQVSLLAWDDSALCALAVPPLSAMSIDVHEHGLTLGRAVRAALDGAPPREFAGPPIRIISRASTGPLGERADAAPVPVALP